MPAKRASSTRNKTERGHLSALRRVLTTWPGVTVQTKFHNASFQVGKKVFAFTRPEGVAIKLPEARIRSVIQQRGAAFLVMGKRTMREWMLLHLADSENVSEDDLRLLREAMEFVAGTFTSRSG